MREWQKVMEWYQQQYIGKGYKAIKYLYGKLERSEAPNWVVLEKV
jgi:hypothetical protein